MSRSTKADKARQLNAAHRLLERNTELSDAAQSLSREFGLSRRQAYRYLKQAAELGRLVPVEEASIPITLKLPPNTVRRLRSYAARSGLTLGESVTQALRAFLNALRRHG
jgi:predicted DNA-binding transcriptional regulator YafY